jgi:hypothetical protein
MTTDAITPEQMSTIGSILFAVFFVLWRTYEDNIAKAWRKKADEERAIQGQQIREIQDALGKSPFITYPNPYDK